MRINCTGCLHITELSYNYDGCSIHASRRLHWRRWVGFNIWYQSLVMWLVLPSLHLMLPRLPSVFFAQPYELQCNVKSCNVFNGATKPKEHRHSLDNRRIGLWVSLGNQSWRCIIIANSELSKRDINFNGIRSKLYCFRTFLKHQNNSIN